MMRLKICTAVVLLGLLGGCTATPVEPPPAKVTEPTTQPRPTSRPAVSHTLALSQYRGNPCALLTTEQQVTLELPPLDRQSELSCRFERPNPHSQLNLTLYPDRDVLGGAHQEANDEKWERFEPFTIAGQPAVKRSLDPPGQHITCEVVVATGPDQGVTISASGSNRTIDWCTKASQATEYVVRNIGG